MSATICPGCGQPNKFADEEGFTDGPPEYHADCWAALPQVPTITDPEDGLICGACGRGHHGEPCPHVPNAITRPSE